MPGSAAARAGVRANDSIVSVNGRPVPVASGGGHLTTRDAFVALIDLAAGRSPAARGAARCRTRSGSRHRCFARLSHPVRTEGRVVVRCRGGWPAGADFQPVPGSLRRPATGGGRRARAVAQYPAPSRPAGSSEGQSRRVSRTGAQRTHLPFDRG
ncbi:PDZ domain-containing protein [Sphingomonas hankookensis]|uniref:PDZ domain-containing protein n=1 Tax=Sphingomonas hankookensis TaxID=563996 RepID=UPI003F7AC5D2